MLHCASSGGPTARKLSASSLKTEDLRRPMFPRSNERGPIEVATASRLVTPDVALFPRSNERGPIEVRRRPALARSWRTVSALERARPH